jgi:hypothetical protein
MGDALPPRPMRKQDDFIGDVCIFCFHLDNLK